MKNILEQKKVGEWFQDPISFANCKILRKGAINYVRQTNSSMATLMDFSKNGGDTFKAGEGWRTLVNVQKLESGKQSLILGLNQHRNSIALRVTELGYRAYPFQDDITFKVTGMDGKEKQPETLEYGVWYYFDVVLKNDIKLKKDRGFALGYNLRGKTEIWFADMTLRRETFRDSLVGDGGSEFFGNTPLQFGKVDYALNNNILHIHNHILEFVLPFNTISPEFLGYRASEYYDTSNPVSGYLQDCLDSDYNVFLSGGLLYFDKPVFLRKPKKLKMQGSTYSIKMGNSLPAFESPASNKFLTVCWTDRNIPLLVIQTGYGFISHGLFDVSRCLDYDSGTVVLDGNYRCGHNTIEKVTIQGNPVTIVQEGKGSKGFYADLNINADTSGYGFFAGNRIIDCAALYCDIGVGSSPEGKNWDTPRNFHNTFNVRNFKTDGCKRPISFKSGNANNIELLAQDRNVLPDSEKHFPIVEATNARNTLNFFCYDRHPGQKGDAPHRHAENYLILDSPDNILQGNYWNMHHPNDRKKIEKTVSEIEKK